MAEKQNSNPYALEGEAASALLAQTPVEEVAFSCDLDGRDHVHVARIGEPGGRADSRGLIVAHEGGSVTRTFLAAPRMRQLAAALLNVADEIDGQTPLAFVPRSSDEE